MRKGNQLTHFGSGKTGSLINAGLILIALVLALLMPVLFPSRYYVMLFTNILLFSICAESLNLLMGFSGQVSLGHGTFFMIGSYTYAIMTKTYGANQWVAILGAIVICIVFGLLLGIPSCKVSAIYLVMVTMGFNSVVTLFMTNEAWLTNGPNGITGISKFMLFGHKCSSTEYYYVCLAALILVVLLIRNVVRSRSGRAFMALRGNTIAAASMGINVNLYKLMAFALSAAIAGFAGALYCINCGMTGPSLFTSHSFLFLSSTLVGGVGSLAGPIMGSALLTMLPEWLRAASTHQNGIYGVLMAVVILFLPFGIYGGVKALVAKLAASLEKHKSSRASASGGEV